MFLWLIISYNTTKSLTYIGISPPQTLSSSSRASVRAGQRVGFRPRIPQEVDLDPPPWTDSRTSGSYLVTRSRVTCVQFRFNLKILNNVDILQTRTAKNMCHMTMIKSQASTLDCHVMERHLYFKPAYNIYALYNIILKQWHI